MSRVACGYDPFLEMRLAEEPVSTVHTTQPPAARQAPRVTTRRAAYTWHMRLFILAAAALLIASVSAWPQTAMKPAAPGTAGDPAWQGTVHMSDGRTFITDGGLAVDAAFAKPATLPAR